MAARHYTKEELHNLRNSPLVQKPDDLPAIEQWLEYVYADPDSREKLRIPHSESQQSNATARRQAQGSKTGGDSPMGSFSTGVRPGLMGRGSARGDDVSLGPPRTMFPSSRNVSKMSDFTGEKGEAGAGDEQEGGRSRFFGDKANRKSGNEKDSWTTVRDKRHGGGEEGRFEPRFNRRDRDQDGEKRNGFGEKGEGRWGERRQNGDRTSWRDRERDRKDRGWEREQPAEKEPEWMDDPAPPSAEDDLRTMGMPRNQEQFQKWKEAMSGKKAPAEDDDATETVPVKEMLPAKTTAPLKLEGIVDKPFGSWADPKTGSAGSLDSATASAKSAQSKGKSSRFASMFKDNQPKEEPSPAEAKAPTDVANGSAEDEAGFKRILQMLGGTGIGPPQPQEGPSSPPPAKNATNGTKQKSRFTGFFDQTPKSPERMQSPPDAGFRPESEMVQVHRGFVDEPSSMFGSKMPENQPSDQSIRGQIGGNQISPESMQPPNGNREQQQQAPQHQRMNDIFLDQPPSRGTASPDINIQNLIASQRAQRPQGQDKNSEFLLNLLQTKGSRPSPQQARQESNFPIWLDQPPNMPEPHAPKPRAPPPPGLFEDQLLRNAPQEQLRQEMPQQMPGNEMPHRRTSQRAPPGFYDEQALFMQQQQQQQAAAQQRRAFAESQQQQQLPPGGRRMSGHPNLAQMQIPNQQHFPPGPPQPPPDFLQSPGAGPGPQGPPPGFHPQMPRHPPGLHNTPNIFQAPQQSQPQLPHGREPPGFGGMQQPPPGQMQSPPGAPPGFFGGMPPGYGMQMRSPTEGMPAGAMRGGRPFEGGYEGMGGGPPPQRR